MKRIFSVKKAKLLILSLNIVQAGAILFLLLYSFLSTGLPFKAFGISGQVFLTVIIVTSLTNGLISIRDINLLAESDAQYHLLQDTLTKVENMNHTLRAQRHDFLNHLQVVYGLMEMEEFTEARDYIDKVYKDIQKVSRALKTAIPAINALLQAKSMDAEKRNIEMVIDVSSRLENFPIPSWEFCRVLGNLTDNALTALEEIAENRSLKITFREDPVSFILCVEDNGPGIHEHLLDKIFHPGFTTKSEHGEGMGLAIVKKILSQYNSSITVESGNSTTVFIVTIPKKGVNGTIKD